MRVVRGAAFTVQEGESVALVGESGCGKTLSALALTNLVPPPGRIVGGTVQVAGHEVRELSDERLQVLRGGVVGYLFQEPGLAFNPLRRVGFQVAEAGVLRYGWKGRQAQEHAVRLLRAAGLEEGAEVARAYPHQLSGGQRQRALLAAALAGDPQLVVLDEPTSALDPLAQERLLGVVRRLREERHLALVLITHDLALAARMSEAVVVMYAGETVEAGPMGQVTTAPRHPYTQALLRCAWMVAPVDDRTTNAPQPTVPGRVPPPAQWGGRCRFAPRCPRAVRQCGEAHPALTEVAPGWRVRCFLHAADEDPHG